MSQQKNERYNDLKTDAFFCNRKLNRGFLNLLLSTLAVLLFPGMVAAADFYTFRDKGGDVYFTNIPGHGHHKVRLPLKKDKLQMSGINVSCHIEAYEPIIASTSEHFTVDSDLIRAVIKTESNFNPQAISPRGALGLMQLMPGTAQEMGVADPFDPVENIRGGVRYLSRLLVALDGDFSLALAAYNAGLSRVIGQNKVPPIQETRDYVERVLNYYRNLKNVKKL
ncbi:MAG: lytic transglycosylase domain-containing protein [Syntrophales bacterium]